MVNDHARLMELAAAVADLKQIDWSEAESTAEPGQRHLIRQLEVLARLAQVHRQVVEDPAPRTDSAAADPSKGPTHWGALELRRELGKGGFATVHVAWDPRLEREVALKVLRHIRDADMMPAVIREARLLARVHHPNVVTVYGVDQLEGSVGLWMELVDGLTLKQFLAITGALDPREAALITIDVCRAVAAVHKAGLLHRDIKAQNVMRESGGRIVLMDFGAGELLGEAVGGWGMTGTPLYMAPEILAGRSANVATDIYSLGVLLYHLVTLRYPIEADDVDALRAAHAAGHVQLLSDVRPDLPQAFVHVVNRALDPDPARRYRSAGALQADLAGALGFQAASDGGFAAPAPADHLVTQSVAVLPFLNLGPDQDIDYFCDGLAEDLLTGLGKVRGLRVASRTSSFAFKGTSADIRTICKQLNVDAVLEGSVRKFGSRLRVTAQLVSGADGCHIWSEGYDRQMADVFVLQDEIAHSVVDRLKTTVAEFPLRPLIRRYTDNPRAYHSYLKGRFHWSHRYSGGLRAALEHFQKAIDEDAGYALAQVGVADAYSFLGFYSVQRPKTAFERAAAALERALAIDPELPEAHTSLALLTLGSAWNCAEAQAQFKRALTLDPTQTLARIYYAWMLVLMGDPATASMHVRIALEMDPMSPLVRTGSAYMLFLCRQYEESVLECQKALEVDPGFIIAIYVMGMCRAQQSQFPEAIELMERAATMARRAPFYIGLLGNLYGRAGIADKAHGILRELEERQADIYVPPHAFAYVHAGLGDLDEAFAWQARAFDDGASPFNYFSPIIEVMQADPRHAIDTRRMGWKVEAVPLPASAPRGDNRPRPADAIEPA
jgi:TolB-like protein/Tfp pilus assembly protein PilF